MRGIDAANNTGRVSNIATILVPNPPPTTAAATVHRTTSLHHTVDSNNSSRNYNGSSVTSMVASDGWRPYVVAGAAILGLLMVGAAAIACICCCRKAKERRKEKDPDRPVYKIYVNNAYIQEDDGEIKVVSNGQFTDDKKRSGQVCGGLLSSILTISPLPC